MIGEESATLLAPPLSGTRARKGARAGGGGWAGEKGERRRNGANDRARDRNSAVRYERTCGHGEHDEPEGGDGRTNPEAAGGSAAGAVTAKRCPLGTAITVTVRRRPPPR